MEDISWLQIVIILGSGIIAGFVNTMAGGGSFLTLAALDFAGLPILLANGTNRVAVLIQNVAAVLGFRSKGVSDFKLSLQFAIPAALGSLVGAYVVVDWPEAVFKRVLAGAMLLMLGTLMFDSKRWIKEHQVKMTRKRLLIAYPLFFVIGFYGGAIQAGVGFLLIASLVMVAGVDLVRANSHKVFIIAAFTVVAVIIFILRDQINWVLGLVLSVGNATGAWIASRLAVEKGSKLVRIVLAVMLVFLTVRYLGLIPGL